MCLNADKFEHHRIGNNLGIEKHIYKDPTGKNIQEIKYIRDLGIHISDDLTWTKQINEVVSRARSMSGWTMRTFQTRERECPCRQSGTHCSLGACLCPVG